MLWRTFHGGLGPDTETVATVKRIRRENRMYCRGGNESEGLNKSYGQCSTQADLQSDILSRFTVSTDPE